MKGKKFFECSHLERKEKKVELDNCIRCILLRENVRLNLDSDLIFSNGRTGFLIAAGENYFCIPCLKSPDTFSDVLVVKH
jgi:hypothetical protein